MARTTPTWVYVMTCKEHAKIGIATDVAARQRGLQGSNPFEVAVYGKRLFADYPLARQIETELHEEFAEYRGFGEWFLVEPQRVMASLERREAFHRQPVLSLPTIAASPGPLRRQPGWTDAEWHMAKALAF